MNYLPFCGYWFIGAVGATQLASFFDSYGLLAVAPSAVPVIGGGLMMMMHIGG